MIEGNDGEAAARSKRGDPKGGAAQPRPHLQGPARLLRAKARVDLRRKLLYQQFASHHQHEYEKLLAHYSGIMGPTARAEDLKLRAREHAQKLFGHLYHGHRT